MAEIKNVPTRGEFWDFVDWLRATLGRKEAARIIRTLNLSNYQQSIAYSEWVRVGKPNAKEWEERQQKAGMTPEERGKELLTGLGGKRTAEGAIPDEGLSDEEKTWLTSQGWELTSTDAQGFPVDPFWSKREEEEEEPPTPNWDVEAISGRDAWVLRDAQGNIIDFRDLGATPTTEPEGDLAEREFQWRVSQAGLDRAAQQKAQQLQAWTSLQQTLAGKDKPEDWIDRWNMIHGTMKQFQLRNLQEQKDTLLRQAQGFPSTGLRTGEFWETARSGQPVTFNMWDVAPIAAERLMLEMQAENLQTEIDKLSNEIQMAGTPPAPAWLPQFAPGQIAGQPITKERAVTPSGQQWIATPQSERMGLKGYAEWAGYEPFSDILDRMAMMQPYTPNVTGRWSPAKQWA